MIDAWLHTKLTMLTVRVTTAQTTARQNSNLWPNKYALCFSNPTAPGVPHTKNKPKAFVSVTVISCTERSSYHQSISKLLEAVLR